MPEQTPVNDLRNEAVALVELESRRRASPLYFYEPVPKVADLHTHRAMVRLMVGSNRSGKSETGMAEGAGNALGYRPWVLRKLGIPCPDPIWKRPANLPEDAICFTGAGIRIRVPNEVLIVSGQPIKTGIGQTLFPKLQKLLGPAIKDVKVSHAGTPALVILQNDTRIYFQGIEQKLVAFESTSHDFCCADEPIPRPYFTAIRRGAIDRFARIIMSFTPIGVHSGWLFRDLYSKADDKTIAARTLSIFDNPYLPPEAIEEFVNNPAISDIEKQARIHGRFIQLLDRLYPQFNPDIHVLSSFRPPDSWFVGCVVDPHVVRPWFIAYFCVNPRGDVIFFKEHPAGDFTKIRRDPKSYDEYAEILHRLDADQPATLRLLDPNFGPRRDINRASGLRDESIVSYFARFGIYFHTDLNDDLDFGESRVRQLLAYNEKEPLSDTNRPRLYVTEDCPNIIASLTYYTTATDAEGFPIDGKRDETYKDGADVVRYVAVSDVGRALESDLNPVDFGASSDDDLNISCYGE